MRQLLGANYWDSITKEIKGYQLERNIAIYEKYEYIKLIKKWNKGLNGKKILKTDLYEEAFTGNHFLFWLTRQNANVFGIDISHEIVKKSQLYPGRINGYLKNCITSDIRRCAFRDESFDLIISNSTLDNLVAQDATMALAELKRILKPKGILILTLDNGHNPLYCLGYAIEKFLKTNKYYQDQCYSIKKAKTLAEQNNFVIQDITAIVHIPTPFNKIAIFLQKINGRVFQKFIRYCISLFSRLGNKRTKLLTGWYIALKLIKK